MYVKENVLFRKGRLGLVQHNNGRLMKLKSPRLNIPDCCLMTNIHLAAICIPLSAYPIVLFCRPVNQNSVKCFLDIISYQGPPWAKKITQRIGGEM